MDALLKLKKEMTKEFGERSVVFANEIPDFQVITTGSLALDYAIGIGGFPHNRVIEIGGEEGTGKTTLSLITIANFLDRYPDKGAAIIDMEHRLTSSWIARLIGEERTERCLILWPDSAEQSTDMYVDCACSGAVSVILYDSVGGAPSQRVTQKSATIGEMGGNALPMSRLAKFSSIYSDKYDVLTIFINQEREDMSGYQRYTTPGGRALKHAYSLRIRLRKGKERFSEKLDGEEMQVGYSVRAQIVKNSLGAPHRECYYLFYNVPTEKYGFGIDALEETVRLGVITGVIGQKGAGYFMHDALPGGQVRGQATLVETVRDHPEVRGALVTEIRDRLASGRGAGVAPTFDPDVDEEVEATFFTGLDEDE
jgi:recombination protein RecA